MSRDSRLYLGGHPRGRNPRADLPRRCVAPDARFRPAHRDAVLHNLEVIGEAVKKLQEDLTERHPAVDWSGFARMRDVLAHQYFVADLDIVWQAVNEELPGLEAAVKELLTKGGGG